MRTRILLVALGIGAALAPAPAAQASCIDIEGVGCINPSCIVAGAGNAVLETAGVDERLHCTR